MSQSINDATLLQIPSMLHCKERLKTFTNWPFVGSISKEEMAKAGFIYLGFEDWTMCAFCGVRVYKWQQTDVPYKEHKKHTKHCSYLTLTHVEEEDETSNIPPANPFSQQSVFNISERKPTFSSFGMTGKKF